jgi:hypothetical protein
VHESVISVAIAEGDAKTRWSEPAVAKEFTVLSRRALIVFVVLVATSPLATGQQTGPLKNVHVWQPGIWRDIRVVSGTPGAMTLPVGGSPPVTIGNTTVPGTAPMYLTVPIDDKAEYVTIDGPDRLRYVARWRKRFKGVIINDPVEFSLEGDHLFIRGSKGEALKLELVSTIRLEE